jgi:hypothetical protein
MFQNKNLFCISDIFICKMAIYIIKLNVLLKETKCLALIKSNRSRMELFALSFFPWL